MYIKFKKQHILSKRDRKLISDLTSNMFPYLKLLDTTVDKSDKKAKQPELAMYNRLYGGDKAYFEEDIEKALAVINKIKGHIKERIRECEQGIDSIPDEDNVGGFALVVNPTDYFKMMVDNYTSQIKGMEQIEYILLTDTGIDSDDDEL